MLIRQGTPADRDEVMALYRSHIGEEGVTWDEEYPNEEIFDTWDVGQDNLFCMIDEENGKICAVVSIEDDTGANEKPVWNRKLEPALHFARVGVAKGCEGKGLARKLIRHVLDVMRERGMRGARYLVGKENLRAQAAYRALGFHLAGEIHFYEHDYLCYELDLAASSNDKEN